MGNAVEFMNQKVFEMNHRNGTGKFARRYYHIFKRTLDILASFIGLILLSPLFLFVAIRIRLDSPGPVFYRGSRAGRGGKEFKVLKFRTMYERLESYNGARITAQDDNRLTPVGAWLSDTKLNELPQLWNVLVGEMSFVGPRPEDYGIAMQWPVEIRNEILSVRPGITSPASVIYRDEKKMLQGSGVMDDYLRKIMPEKQRLDQLYVRQRSLIGDLDVIFMTLILLLPGLRKVNPPEVTLYSGPFSRFSSRYVSWFIADTVTAFIAISIAGGLWRLSAPLDLGWDKAALIAAFLAICMSIVNSFFGLKKIQWRTAGPIYVFDLAVSTLLSMMIFWSASMYLIKFFTIPLPMLVDFAMFAFFGFVAVRYRERLITGLASRWVRWRSQTSIIGERVLVIGAGDCGQLGIWLIEKSDLAPAFSIVGIVDDDFHKQFLKVNGYPVLGTTRDIAEIVARKNIGVIVFAINKVDQANRERIIDSCLNLPVRIIMIPDLLKVMSNYLAKQSEEVPNAEVA